MTSYGAPLEAVMRIFAEALENFNRAHDMYEQDKRYYVRTDGQVKRNTSKRPLLHNGKKPR